jgi:hypothetical protein
MLKRGCEGGVVCCIISCACKDLFYKLVLVFYSIKKARREISLLTLVSIPNSLQESIKASARFSPECGPDSLRKSASVSINFQLSSIQWAVMPRNEIAFGDVQVSSVKEIRPGAF